VKGEEGKGDREGKEWIRKKERVGREKGEGRGSRGRGDRDGRESLEGKGGREGKAVGKRVAKEKFRWATPTPPFFFRRTAPDHADARKSLLRYCVIVAADRPNGGIE